MIQAAGGVVSLPLCIVKVMIGSPNRVRRLLSWPRLVEYAEHAVERLYALQVAHVAVTHRQQHIPHRGVRVEGARRLTIHGPELENALHGQRGYDASRPQAAGVSIKSV